MSDSMMSVARARRLTDGGHHTVHTGLVMPAARTIVHQAEQIERLQEAITKINEWSGSGMIPRHLIEDGIILPGDMEATDE